MKKMDETEEASVATGLDELIDAHFALESLESPTQENAVLDAIAKVPGVRNATLAQGKLLLQYDPIETTQEKIRSAIEGAGFQIEELQVTTSSAMTDALQKQAPKSDQSDAPANKA